MSWLIKRGSTYYIGYTNNGKDIYKTTRTKNPQEAETKRLEFDLGQRRQNGADVGPTPDMSIDAVIELYKKDTDLKDKTEKINMASWNKFKTETGIVKIGEATTEKIAEFRDKLLDRDYSNASVSLWLRDVKKLFTYAKDSGLILKNPAKAVELPDEDEVFRFFTLEEEATLLSLANPLLARILVIGFETGLRITQNIEMDWKHYRPQEHIYYVAPQKRQKARYIPISERALAAMGPIHLSGPIHPVNTNRNQIGHMWTRLIKCAGIIGRARIHDIRHTYVSRVCKVLDPIEVRDLMGWCSVSMVDRYTHSRVVDIQAKLGRKSSVRGFVYDAATSLPLQERVEPLNRPHSA